MCGLQRGGLARLCGAYSTSSPSRGSARSRLECGVWSRRRGGRTWCGMRRHAAMGQEPGSRRSPYPLERPFPGQAARSARCTLALRLRTSPSLYAAASACLSRPLRPRRGRACPRARRRTAVGVTRAGGRLAARRWTLSGTTAITAPAFKGCASLLTTRCGTPCGASCAMRGFSLGGSRSWGASGLPRGLSALRRRRTGLLTCSCPGGSSTA